MKNATPRERNGAVFSFSEKCPGRDSNLHGREAKGF
jgi:hypothetical protein